MNPNLQLVPPSMVQPEVQHPSSCSLNDWSVPLLLTRPPSWRPPVTRLPRGCGQLHPLAPEAANKAADSTFVWDNGAP